MVITDKISHTTKTQSTSSPTKSSNSRGNSSNSGQEKSKTRNPSSSTNSGSSKTTSNQPSSSSRLDLTNKLGKDGKLTADECKWHLENNLCMFCGGTGHFTDNCPKKTKKAKAHAAAVKSRSTPVGGPVKSGRKRMKEKGRGLDKGLVRPELRPIGFNDKGVEH